MPRWMLCLMTLVMACALWAATVPNPSFEKVTTTFLRKTPEHVLTNWTYSNKDGSTGDWAFDLTRAHGGRYALKMLKTNSKGYAILQSDFIPVEEGKSYVVRAWLNVYEKSGANIYLMVSQYPPTGTAADLPNVFGKAQTFEAKTAWQKLEVPVGVRKGNTRLRIAAIAAKDTANISWDDFEVTEEKPAEPVKNPEPAKNPDPPIKNTNPLVKDPDPVKNSEPVKNPDPAKNTGPVKNPEASKAPITPTPPVEPPLDPSLLKAANRMPAYGRILTKDGRRQFLIDGKPTAPVFYVAPFGNPDRAQIDDFKQAGVRVYLMPLMLGRDSFGRRGVWVGPGRYDWSDVDNILQRVLKADPDGYIMFYLYTDPYRDWGIDHPTEVCTDQHGKKVVVTVNAIAWDRLPQGPVTNASERYGPSAFSAVLREETTAALRALVEHINGHRYGKAVIGYHLLGLNVGQFLNWIGENPKDPHLADYSPAAQRAFRAWLRQRYQQDVQQLRRAWRQPEITFDTAAIPSGERRMGSGFLLDTRTDMDIIDYNRFYNDGMVDTICQYARTIRQASADRAMVGVYYSPDIAGSHYALGRLLQSPDVDFLVNPALYNFRLPTDPGGSWSVSNSIQMHGKLWLTEQDWRTWLANASTPEHDKMVGRATNLSDLSTLIRRESGSMLAANQGTWWYDMSGGWFHDQQIMRVINETRNAFERAATLPEAPRADVAVFVNERSFDYFGSKGATLYRVQGVMHQMIALNRSGVPYHMYLQEDLVHRELPEYKVYIFLNAQAITPEERRMIRTLHRDEKVLVFVHAPGIFAEEWDGGDQAELIREITGISVTRLPQDIALSAEKVGWKHPLLQGIDGKVSTGSLRGTAFAVNDHTATALATYANGEVAVACRDSGTWKSVFFGPIGVSSAFMHNLAQWGDAWTAADAGDVVYASQYFITINALTAGEKVLTLHGPSRIVDMTTDQLIAERDTQIRLQMKAGETRWFALTPVKGR